MSETEPTSEPIEQIVQDFREHRMSRARFFAVLGGLGASAAGIGALAASGQSGGGKVTAAATPANAHPHVDLHQSHVSRQAAATVGSSTEVNAEYIARLKDIMADYAPDAVVEDPMVDQPVMGNAAIAERKVAEMTAMGNVAMEVTHRFAHGDQVVAEWTLTGRHQGRFREHEATGKAIGTRGVTVVTRKNGKIVRESLYYDVEDMRKQLSGSAGSA